MIEPVNLLIFVEPEMNAARADHDLIKKKDPRM
jgi:hypothetical protein